MLFPEVKKILILKWGALGDLVMITSTIKAEKIIQTLRLQCLPIRS